MKLCKLRLWLALALVSQCLSVVGAAETTAVKDNAREYLALRQSLKATPLTTQQMIGPRAPWRGKSVEVFGKILGRTNASVSGGLSVITVGLRLPGQTDLLMVDSAQESDLLTPDQVVHILAELPEGARPADNFLLRAVIAEDDLPAAEQRYAAAVAAVEQAASLNPRPGSPVPPAPSPEKGLKPAGPPTATEAPQPPPQPAKPITRPGTQVPQMPQLTPSAGKAVGAWKKWVGGINPKLTDPQLEVIVRSVIYYSALLGLDHRLSFAMIKCESDFDPKCLSHSGAMGLTQLMPFNATDMGVDPWDLEQNIKGGLTYLSRQLHKFPEKSNYDQCILGLACYNAGPGAVKRAGGVPNIPETVRYVKKVGDLFYQLYKAGMP